MHRTTIPCALVTCCLFACGDDTAGSAEDAASTGGATTTATSASTGPDVPTSSATEPTPTTGTPPTGDARIYLHFGADISSAVATRVTEHIEAAATLPVEVVDADASLTDIDPASLVFGFGDTPSTRLLIPLDEVTALGSEGFVLRSGTVAGAAALVADGNAIAPDPFGHASLGDGFAAYALLEELGFAFLHPLAPTRPPALTMPAALDRSEAPHWPFRGLQLHTMHPIELTHVLQGWGPNGPEDEAGWTALLPEWDAFLEWMLANRQNRVHWIMLGADSWMDFADGPVRQERFTTLVGRGHEFGVWIGADAPLVQHQQHTWRLIQQTGELADEIAQIHERVDHLMASGFDYFATESGTTEFTSSDDQRMVAWMDALATHVDEAHGGRETYIKIHTSTGQTVENYKDPETDEPLNFNFLPHYADPRMGVMPHTVQHYGLDDPAPTYGNTDYAFMREFLQEEVGTRKVVWHPETAYWVSFDIDTPLFLPVYAERRLHDLRTLGRDELAGKMGRGEHAGKRMDGQSTFSSGWEWGYWLPEVVTARAAWNPRMDLMDDAEALRVSLAPVVRPFGPVADQVSTLLIETIAAQRRLLILGLVDGVGPEDITKRNGQAYMQGFEAWDDISDLAESVPGLDFTMTQPERLGLVEMRGPHLPPGYSAEVEPLLAAMETEFTALADGFAALQDQVPAHARPLYDDLVDAARITALRATQIHGLYDYVDGLEDQSEEWEAMRLGAARTALDQALVIAKAREANYRVDADRIAGWGTNPTAYRFGYLWTVRDLYYWWRDEGKAVEAPVNPCYLNIISPIDIGFGEGTLYDATQILGEVADGVPGIGSLAECAAAPASAPVLPPPGLRDMP